MNFAVYWNGTTPSEEWQWDAYGGEDGVVSLHRTEEEAFAACDAVNERYAADERKPYTVRMRSPHSGDWVEL